MSRIGKMPVALPSGVKVSKQAGGVLVEGPKGKLKLSIHRDIQIAVDDQKKELRVGRPSDQKIHRALHGTTRAILKNAVKGVLDLYEKKLEINGVGYNAKIEGKILVINVGYADPRRLPIPEGLQVECPKPTEIFVRGVDKQLVGEFAAEARRVRPPEPYNAKGIKYSTEKIKRKAGKAFGSGEK